MSATSTEATPPQPWLLLPGFMPDAVGFAVRTTLSLLLAYGVAFWMQLDSASSAGVCVAIVAQPAPGMAMSKALYRIAGTVLGGFVAILVVAVFGQDRTMLLAAFTAWLGACTFVATLLRDFRSYGAALCGYTVGIVAIASIDAPDAALLAALNRVAAILLGVAAVALVNGLLSRQVAFETLVEGLRRGLADMRGVAAGALRGLRPDDEAGLRRGGEVLALTTQASYAATELPDGWLRTAGARNAVAALLGMLSASRALGVTGASDAEAAASFRAETPRQAFVVERIADLRQQQGWAEQGLATLVDGTAPTRHVGLRRHHDLEGAARNAARTVIAVGLGCVFCVYAGWGGATLLLIQQAALTALLGMTVNPSTAAAAMGYALPFGALAAGIVGFVLLPLVSGFVPFALAVGAAAMLASLAARHPATANLGPGLLLYFTLLLGPSNPQQYDLASFANNCLIQVLAVLFVALAFRLVLPVSPRRRRRRVAEAIWADLRAVLRRGGDLDQAGRQTLNYDRLAQGGVWLGRPTPARLAALHRLYAFAELDTALRRAWSGLRDAALDAPALAQPIAAARRSLERCDPDAMLVAGQALLDRQDDGPDPDALLRAVSGLYGAQFNLRREMRALRRYGVLDGVDVA